MPNQLPPRSAPSKSANDNGPLTTGQVKALKITIGVMSFLVVALMIIIIGRVIYMASMKEPDASSVPPSLEMQSAGPILEAQTLNLPAGATVQSMSLHQNRLLVHYRTPAGPGAAVLDLTTGKPLSRITIKNDR